MGSPAEVEISAIIAPIPGENPAGVDIRADGVTSDFRAIKDAREEARRLERQADNAAGDDAQAADMAQGAGSTASLPCWRTVRDLSQKLLQTQSKDLAVAAFMIEALLRTDGLVGLRWGFEVTRRLVDEFWDKLYPLPDEDGIATRTLPIQRLNGGESEGLLVGPLARVPITEGTSAGPYAIWQYRQSTKLATYPDKDRENRIKRGAVTPEKFKTAMNETSTEFCRSLVQELTACQAEFKALVTSLDARCGKDSPGSTAIAEALDSCLTEVKNLYKDRLPAEPPPTKNAGPAAAGAALAGQSADPMPEKKTLATREDAFQSLLSVAEFFERTEPLSLLPAQIRKVVRLGRLSPAEYYSELIEDKSVRDQIFKMVGIAPPPKGEKEK